jgi:hypothetical protein
MVVGGPCIDDGGVGCCCDALHHRERTRPHDDAIDPIIEIRGHVLDKLIKTTGDLYRFPVNYTAPAASGEREVSPIASRRFSAFMYALAEATMMSVSAPRPL